MLNQETGEILPDKDFLHIPANNGGAVVHRSQIVGARPNGSDQGAIVYTKAGPSIYTTLSTRNLAAILEAEIIEASN